MDCVVITNLAQMGVRVLIINTTRGRRWEEGSCPGRDRKAQTPTHLLAEWLATLWMRAIVPPCRGRWQRNDVWGKNIQK